MARSAHSPSWKTGSLHRQPHRQWSRFSKMRARKSRNGNGHLKFADMQPKICCSVMMEGWGKAIGHWFKWI
jgi:hypothetical protein